MPEIDQERLSAAVAGILARRPAVGLALGVVRDGALEFFAAHGLADVATRRPVCEDTVFRVASITKTFTAIAVLQLVEQGLVDLDAPANAYLRTLQVVPRRHGWPAATVRQLLTHTAGLGEEVPRRSMFRRDFGESVPVGRPVPSLAEFYGGLVPLDAEPGTRFRYTDHGPAVLGQLVEDVSHRPLAAHLREHVFGPLGMTDTDLEPSDAVRARLATGYRLGARGLRAVAARDVVTAGAAMAFSTPRDLSRYLAALMGGGGNEHGAVLQPATLASMFAPQFRPDPRIPGMGLAFFRGDLGGHLVVEHQGVLPGFDSQVVVAPADAVGVLAVTNGTRQGGFWLPAETGRLLAGLLGVPPVTIRTDVPHHPEVWAELCGVYRLPGPLSDVRVRAMVGAGAQVFLRRGRPHLRFLTPVPALARGFALHPDDPEDPYVFRIDLLEAGLVTMKLVFTPDPPALHADLMPVSLYRRR